MIVQALLNFVLIVGPLVVFVLLIIYTPGTIRKYRLSKVAKKFNLSFDAGKMFYLSTPEEIKKNIIKGIINGHNVELYDSLITYYRRVSLGFVSGGYLSKRNTVISIDNGKEVISQWLGWYAPVFKIKKILKNIH